MTIGSIPLADYATTGTDEVAASLAPCIPGHEAILMANHGAVSYGGTLLKDYQRMETVEHLAHVSLVARQLGSPRPLCAEQIMGRENARSKYVQKL
jgi:L-fuculose-phosphate aldolase